tara:strand:- start:355 stop:879 length:525 start_codon:yes stop_codon:yes gene_type:complete
MKLFKNIPFLLSLFIIIILSVSNQKQYTRLKILIWKTPSLSLGNYLAISTGTGFLISYIVINNLFIGNKNTKNELKYKIDNQKEDINLNNDTNNLISYDNTFIERDVKDPSPTMNASFRIIGNSNIKNQSLKVNQYNKYDLLDDQYDEIEKNHENDNELMSIQNDWEDNSYTDW